MNRRNSLAVGVLACLAAVAIPISASFCFAKRYIQDQELQRLGGLAGEVLRRSEQTRAQINAASDALMRLDVPPCSEQAIARMRSIDVTSSYLQAVGYVANDRLMCTSLGTHGAGIPLGDTTPRRPSGIRAWIGIKLPIVPGNLVNVYERDGFVSIVHPDLVTDILGWVPGMALALYAVGPVQLVHGRGELDERWLRDYKGDTTFVEDDALVAVRVSKAGLTGAIAVMPLSVVDARVRELVWILVPLGLVSGLLMAFAVFYVARQLTSIQAALRSGLRKHEFFLLYQPLVDLRTGECLGAEALIRWRRGGSMIRPDLFIPAAEESGLIRQITARVVDMVARDAAALFR